MICDLDHFKKVNDHYGHAAGDEVLRRMAMILRGSVRATDFLARYGGEEFVVLCPDCDLQTAFRTAERIRARVADSSVSFRNSLIHTTMSIGVTCVEPGETHDCPEILERADQALYRANRRAGTPSGSGTKLSRRRPRPTRSPSWHPREDRLRMR